MMVLVMSEIFNGLQTLIFKDNEFAFYIRCFVHQLQLILVAVAKGMDQVEMVFLLVTRVINVIGSSSKRSDILQDRQMDDIATALEVELVNGKLHIKRRLLNEPEKLVGVHIVLISQTLLSCFLQSNLYYRKLQWMEQK